MMLVLSLTEGRKDDNKKLGDIFNEELFLT